MRLKSNIAENIDGRFIVLENDGIGGHLLRGDRWESHFTKIVQGLPLKNTIALDIGANIGCNTISLAHAVGESGMVVAFEPLRIPYMQLCGNVVLNGFFNVLAMNNAVGEHDNSLVRMQMVDYLAPHINIGNAGVGSDGEQAVMRSLDSFGFSNVSFIKLDVQGSEPAVLRGARNLIAKNRPVLFVEIEDAQLRDRGSSPEALISDIIALDYTLIHINNAYPVDYLCVPAEKRSSLTDYTKLIDSPVNLIERAR